MAEKRAEAKLYNLTEHRRDGLPPIQEINLMKQELDRIESELKALKEENQKYQTPPRSKGHYIVPGTKAHLDSLGLDSKVALLTVMRCRSCGHEWHHLVDLDSGQVSHQSDYWYCPNGCNR